MDTTFILENTFNRDGWRNFEGQVRGWVTGNNAITDKLYITIEVLYLANGNTR